MSLLCVVVSIRLSARGLTGTIDFFESKLTPRKEDETKLGTSPGPTTSRKTASYFESTECGTTNDNAPTEFAAMRWFGPECF